MIESRLPQSPVPGSDPKLPLSGFVLYPCRLEICRLANILPFLILTVVAATLFSSFQNIVLENRAVNAKSSPKRAFIHCPAQPPMTHAVCMVPSGLEQAALAGEKHRARHSRWMD